MRRLDKYFSKLALLLAFTFSIIGVNAQNITLNEKQAVFLDVIKKVKQQSGLDLLGDMKLIKDAGKVSIDVKEAPLAIVLKKLSDGQHFDLYVYDNTILIRPKENDQVKGGAANQNYLFKGGVRGDKNEPIEGASVTNLRNNSGTITDVNGSFEIYVEPNDVLLITMIGYQEERLRVNGRMSAIISIVQKDNRIEEVVVSTGYTSRTKESMTGASTIITRKELEKFNNNNIFSVIQSLDPAFKVSENNANGSNPNALPQISIRGTSSIGEYAVNAPLVIMDGFEVPLQTLYDLDVNRIQSISLLKDASSTVLYGSRGGNGVIVIETRLPKQGKITVTYEAKPSTTVVDLSDYNLMNASQKLEYEKLAGVYTVNPNEGDEAYRQMMQTNLDNVYRTRYLNVLSGVNTYWLSQPVQSTTSIAHSLRIEGGSETLRYSIDGSYNDFKGAMIESGRTRSGAAFNLVYRIPNKVTFRNNASLISTKAYNSPYGSFSLYGMMNPYEPIYNDKGELMTTYNDGILNAASNNLVAYNPLYNAKLPFRDYTTSTQLINTLSFEWYINKNFIFSSKGVISKTFIEGEYFKSPRHTDFFNTDVSEAGLYRVGNGNDKSYYLNAQLTYAQVFNKHAITATAIGEITQDDATLLEHSLVGFADDAHISPAFALKYADNSLPVYSNEPSRLAGAVLTGNYIYNSKYILDVSLRMDGSSKFGSNERSSAFWSVGAGYNLHKENLFNNFFSLLRLYGNVGTNGSDNFNANMTTSYYSLSSQDRYYKLIGYKYINEGNENLKWPQIKSYSAGFDSKFWDDRLSFNFSVYNKITNRMISNITVAPSLGIPGNQYFENLGKVQNTGFESSVNIRIFQNKSGDVNWYVGGGITRNKSKLLEISDELKALNEANLKLINDSIYVQTVYYEKGQSLNNIKGVKSLGIDPNSGREIFVTRTGQITYNWNPNDVQIIGNTEPQLFGTLNTMFNYKAFSLQAFFNYSIGGDIYNQTLVDRVENVNPFFNADIRVLEDRWKQPGDVVAFKAISDRTTTQLSSRFVQKENTLRLSALNINYDVNRALITKYHLTRLRLNFSMNDLFRVSTIKMERGTDYPFSRTFNFGLLVQF